MMYEDDERDREIIKQLKKKKTTFSQVINKKKLDDFELDMAFNEDF